MHADKLINESYKNLYTSLIGIIVNALVINFIFYEHVNDVTLFVWDGLILILSIIRYIFLIKFQSNRDAFSIEKWEQIFTIGVILSAVLWGVTPILFFVHGDYLHQAVIIIIIAGLCSGAVSSLSQILINVQLFLVISIIPLAIELLIQKTVIHYYMAVLVLLYLVLVLFISKKFNHNYVSAISSKLLYEEKRRELLKSEQKFETIFKNVPIGILFYDKELVIQEANQYLINALGTTRDFLVRLDLHRLQDKRMLPAFKTAVSGLQGFYEGEYKAQYVSKSFWISLDTSPIRGSNSNEVIGAVGIVNDLTQRMNMQKRMEHQANYDLLTNVPNRANLLKIINKEITRFRRYGRYFGIMFLDFDHFKNINDSLGHEIGDKLLIQAALRLKKSIRAEDTVARVGGDEFVILLIDLGDDEKNVAKNAQHVANKIHGVVNKAFEIEGHKLSISSSIGIALDLECSL